MLGLGLVCLGGGGSRAGVAGLGIMPHGGATHTWGWWGIGERTLGPQRRGARCRAQGWGRRKPEGLEESADVGRHRAAAHESPAELLMASWDEAAAQMPLLSK